MKTKKEHPAGDQVQDFNTFFEREQLSINEHLKGIDNYLFYKTIHGRKPAQAEMVLQRNINSVFICLKKTDCATVRMLIPPMGYIGETRLRKYLRALIISGKVIETKVRYKCKVSGRPAHYYKALPPTCWY